MSDPSADGTQAADPGMACHIHCGCHVAAVLNGTVTAPPVASSRPSYAPVAEAAPSAYPERLPRPPRA